MEETFGGVSSVVESSLYHNVHSILRELDCEPQAGSASNKGMLRWTLHNRVDRNPSISVPLVRVLIKELEKAGRIDSKIRIIPLLHTLSYAVLQSVFIPEDVYGRMYICLKSLVTLPVPYCTIALHYARQMKMEQTAPGILYQRRVIAEHSLRNDLYSLHEKVFVFIDPAVFPLSLLNALKADVESADPGGDPSIYKRRVLLHTVMAGLGEQCHADQLRHALEHLGEDLELHFQNVVTILEQRTEDGAHDNQYKTRLQKIYQEILTAAKDPSCPASQVDTQLPCPEVSFHVWTKDDEIWNELVNFALMVPAERNSAYLDEDYLKRNSVMSTVSTDSGIEGDLPISEFSSLMMEPQGGPEEQSSSQSFYRRPCVRCPRAGNRMTLMMEAIKGNGACVLTKEERNLTARIVVMGDDRTLGRLAKTLHTIRKREARHLLLTKRVNLEMYYIPVTDQSPPSIQEDHPEDMLTLAGYLGSVDLWYDCNITGLGAMILKLAQMQSVSQSESSDPNTFLLDIIAYYTRVSQHPVHLPIYSVKICFTGLSTHTVEEVFVAQLAMDFPEVKSYRATLKDTIKGSVRYKKYNLHEFHGAAVSINYRKASISDREVERGMSLTTGGVLIRVSPSCRIRSLHSVSISFQDTNPTRPSTPSLRAVSANIRVLEEQTFTVCLDKDPRKTFKNVHSIEVSPCLDPGYCHQPSTKSKYIFGEGGESLSKYLNKTLTLPINTFCGNEQ